MTTLRTILAIAWKDARVRFSSRGELLFFLILPMAFTFILSGGGGGRPAGGQAAGDARGAVAVVDESNSVLSRALIAALDASAAAPADNDVARLIIPAGFDAAVAAGNASLDLRLKPNDLSAIAAQRAVNVAAGQVGRAAAAARQSVEDAERIAPFVSPQARQAWYEASLGEAQALLAAAPSHLAVGQAAQPPGAYDPAAQASAGQLITWVLIPMLGIAALFAYERETGTLRRLRTTPTGRAVMLLGVAGGQFITALVQMALLVGFSALVLGVNWGRSPAGLLLMGGAFGMAGIALGVMLGTFVKSERQATGLSILMGMLMALLGGCWYPLEIFPGAVRAAAHILPTKWMTEGLTDLTRRGLGVSAILPAAAALLAFAAIFFSIGGARFRRVEA